MSEQTSHKQAKIIMGSFETTIVAIDPPPQMRILGFVSSDKSHVFTKMVPVLITPDSFLVEVASSMILNDLDAVLFSGRDLILRASQTPKNKIILLLCYPSKPLYKDPQAQFSLPNFSLLPKGIGAFNIAPH